MVLLAVFRTKGNQLSCVNEKSLETLRGVYTRRILSDLTNLLSDRCAGSRVAMLAASGHDIQPWELLCFGDRDPADSFVVYGVSASIQEPYLCIVLSSAIEFSPQLSYGRRSISILLRNELTKPTVCSLSRVNFMLCVLHTV